MLHGKPGSRNHPIPPGPLALLVGLVSGHCPQGTLVADQPVEAVLEQAVEPELEEVAEAAWEQPEPKLESELVEAAAVQLVEPAAGQLVVEAVQIVEAVRHRHQ